MEYTRALTRMVERALLHNPSFLGRAMDDSASYQKLTKKFVGHEHAALPEVSINPGKLAAADKTFNENIYDAAELAIKPARIKDYDEFFTSFGMRDATVEVYALALRNRFGTYALTEWAKKGKANLVLSAGTERAASYGKDNRKGLKYEDLLSVLDKFSAWNFPTEGRFCIVSEKMLADLKGLTEFKSADYSRDGNVGTYLIGSILGFEVYVFNSLPAAQLNKDTASTALTANSIKVTADLADDTKKARATSIALFTSKYAVRKGMSGLRTRIEGDVEYRADLMTMYMYGGANSVYKNGNGIVLLAENN